MRQFFVAPVPGTNLALIVVEHFPEKAVFHYTKRNDNIPGKQNESILFCCDSNDYQTGLFPNNNMYIPI
jgi:hypothetical protein